VWVRGELLLKLGALAAAPRELKIV